MESLKNLPDFESLPDFMEPHFSLRQLANSWGLSYETIRQWFAHEPNVIRIAHRLRRGKRNYVSIRVPASVARRVYSRHTKSA